MLMFRCSVKNAFCLANQQFVLQKTLQNLLSAEAVFLAQNAAQIVWWPALQHSPDLLAGLRSDLPGREGWWNREKGGSRRVGREKVGRERVGEGKSRVRERWGWIVQF